MVDLLFKGEAVVGAREGVVGARVGAVGAREEARVQVTSQVMHLAQPLPGYIQIFCIGDHLQLSLSMVHMSLCLFICHKVRVF